MTSVEARSTEIDVKFSEVYDTAPALPRPLKTKLLLKYINKEGLMEEAMAVAPLDKTEEDFLKAHGLNDVRSHANDSSITRYVKRNLIYQRKSAEFALVHQELAGWYRRVVGLVANIGTAISFALTVVLYIPLPSIQTKVDNAIAIATLVLSILKAWVQIAEYEVLKAKHDTAARSFGELEGMTTSFLAELADLPADDLKAALGSSQASEDAGPLSALLGASDPELADDAAKAAAAAKTLISIGKISPGEVLEKLKKKAQGSFEQANDHTVDAETDGAEPSEVQKRLRLIYRKALEYRVAHSFFESKYLRLNTLICFIHLILSSAVSAVLFLGSVIPASKTIGIVLSTLLSGLNVVDGSLNLSEKAQEHASGRLAFASVQRRFATTLMVDSAEVITKNFQLYAEQWNSTHANVARIPPAQLQALRDEDNKALPLLPLITPPILDRKAMKAAMANQAVKMKGLAEAKAKVAVSV